MTHRSNRSEEGSIILVILVILVATVLVVTTVSLTERGLRASRRAGDSANALQIADAGISDAVKRAASLTGTTFSSGTVALGDGTYEYTMTKDASEPVWHVVSTGTDRAGLKRRIRADAVARPLEALALFVSANLRLDAGSTVDSYRSPTATCTGKGVVGTNDATTFVLGGAVRNCQPASSWSWPYDGCISFSDTNPAPDFNPDSQCPPAPHSRKASPAFVPESVYPGPGTPPSFTCTPANPIPVGTTYVSSLTMGDGCTVADVTPGVPGSATVIVDGNVTIADTTSGAGYKVHEPPTTCTASGDYRYCAGWAEKLKIYVADSYPARTVSINDQQLKFWGVLVAPTAILTACTGCPQTDWWGSLALGEADGRPQMKIHWDESLQGTTTGRYVVQNWVQEGV